MKKGNFKWTLEAREAFVDLKGKVIEKPNLVPPNSGKVFQVDCDVSGTKIGATLSQERRPTTFLNENLNHAKKKYSAYDQKLYVVVQAFK